MARSNLFPETFQRKPEWLRKRITLEDHRAMKKLLSETGLNTICQEAQCPNISECWRHNTATFLIGGKICTRNCRYCDVETGRPEEINRSEIKQVTYSVQKLGLKFVVITAPSRDDLTDGGAKHFYDVTQNILSECPDTKVELLIPDFKGRSASIEKVVQSGASIIGHNVETVPRLYDIRHAATYERSLEVLRLTEELGRGSILTKSGIMVGLGETENEVIQVFKDLLNVNCRLISIGQYLAPPGEYAPIHEFVHPDQFARYKEIALDLGFNFVNSSPYARSSYLAHEYIQ